MPLQAYTSTTSMNQFGRASNFLESEKFAAYPIWSNRYGNTLNLETKKGQAVTDGNLKTLKWSRINEVDAYTVR